MLLLKPFDSSATSRNILLIESIADVSSSMPKSACTAEKSAFVTPSSIFSFSSCTALSASDPFLLNMDAKASVFKYVSLVLFKLSMTPISAACKSFENLLSISFLFLANSRDIAASFSMALYCNDSFSLERSMELECFNASKDSFDSCFVFFLNSPTSKITCLYASIYSFLS